MVPSSAISLTYPFTAWSSQRLPKHQLQLDFPYVSGKKVFHHHISLPMQLHHHELACCILDKTLILLYIHNFTLKIAGKPTKNLPAISL